MITKEQFTEFAQLALQYMQQSVSSTQTVLDSQVMNIQKYTTSVNNFLKSIEDKEEQGATAKEQQQEKTNQQDPNATVEGTYKPLPDDRTPDWSWSTWAPLAKKGK